MWAIIGGSGFEKFDDFETVESLNRETPFGNTSSGIRKIKLHGVECLFLSRHGEHHDDLPSEINYRANIFALKKYGAKAILSFSAVGSLAKKFKPGDLVVPAQYIDRTKGVRAHTFCGDGIVGHVSLAKPVCESMTSKLEEVVSDSSWESHFGATYVCIEGPYFSTKAESNIYREMGAQIIGMTNFPEYALAREAGLPYLPCCFVTDYDCWDDSIPHVTLEGVLEVMRANNAKAFEIAKAVLAKGGEVYKDCTCNKDGLHIGLMTPRDLIPHDKWSWLEVLIN